MLVGDTVFIMKNPLGQISRIFGKNELKPKQPDPSPESSTLAIEAGSSVSVGDVNRATWGGQLEFLLTCIGYAVGLGNVWRFPYLCYKNGGGAFLIPYILMLTFIGLPLFYMELSFGQFASLGPVTIWRLNPMFKGLGYAMVLSTWMISLYYTVIISHTIHYMFSSMTSVLPWDSCGNYWNKNCLASNYTKIVTAATTTMGSVTTTVGTVSSTIAANIPKTPSEEYYENYVLGQTSGINDIGTMNWRLALALLLAWTIVYFSLIKGVQSLGKVVYFTAIFPYVMLTILLIRGVTLEGAGEGIKFYLTPKWEMLADPRVWSDAATQIFYSLSTCSGGMIAMSSFNKFHNNIYRDSLLVALINCGTSIFAGFVIFSILGFMAHEKGVSVEDVAAGGPGLAFIVYPEALARMPAVAPMWSIFFFLMMATLGFGSLFSMVETVATTFLDEFPLYLSTSKSKLLVRTAIVVISFLLGLPMVGGSGIYLLNLIDYSLSGFPLLLIGLLECVAIVWVYGYDEFASDIAMMIGHRPNIYWKACWVVISPILIIVIILLNVIYYKPPSLDTTDGTYYYPGWADALGWMMALLIMLIIPVWMLWKFCRNGGFQLWKEQNRPLPEWGPALAQNRTDRYSNIIPVSTDSLNGGIANLGYGSARRFGGSIATISTLQPPSQSNFVISATPDGISIAPSIPPSETCV